MTVAEVSRFIKSYNRRLKNRQKEKATFVYILADLIGLSTARIYNKRVNFPAIEQVFPFINEDEDETTAEEKQAKQDELNKIRFKQFADSFNNRFKEVKQDG